MCLGFVMCVGIGIEVGYVVIGFVVVGVLIDEFGDVWWGVVDLGGVGGE